MVGLSESSSHIGVPPVVTPHLVPQPGVLERKKVRERDSSWKDTLSPMLFSILCVYSNSGVCDL